MWYVDKRVDSSRVRGIARERELAILTLRANSFSQVRVNYIRHVVGKWKIISLATWWFVECNVIRLVYGLCWPSAHVWLACRITPCMAPSRWFDWQVTSLCYYLSLEFGFICTCEIFYVLAELYWCIELWQIWRLDCQDLMLMSRDLLDSLSADVVIYNCQTWLHVDEISW